MEQMEKTLFDTVGDELQRARISKKLDVKTVANHLRIRESFVVALETNDYTVFPALVYGIGFLRAYASYLGLEPSTLVERIKQETQSLVSSETQTPIPEKYNVLPSKRIIVSCLILLFCLCLGWYVWSYAEQKTGAVLSPEPMEIVSQVHAIEKAPIEVDTILKETTLLTEELNAVLPLEATKDVIEPVSDASADTSSEQLSDVVDEIKKEPIYKDLTGHVYGQQDGARLVLIAKERVWFDVKDGKTLVFNQIMSKGDGYFVPHDKGNLIMRTGNARGLEVYVDGESKGLLSQTETVKNNIILKPEAFK